MRDPMPINPSSSINWQDELGPLQAEWDRLQAEMQAINAEVQAASSSEIPPSAMPTVAELAAASEREWIDLEQSLLGSTSATRIPATNEEQLADEQASSDKGEGPHDQVLTTGEIIHSIETVAEELFEPQRQAAAEPQWFYARGNQSQGPIMQSQLLKLLEQGVLPWTTLVWHRPQTDWKPASETELVELAGPGMPPPLPGANPKDAPPPLAEEPVCGRCGQLGKRGDRLCSACGQPYREHPMDV